MTNNEEKGYCAKTTISWYPGHMAKAKRQIKKKKIIGVLIYDYRCKRSIFFENKGY